jgi:hypothetical protein
MKAEEIFFAARAAHLSAAARGNSPHRSRKISARGFAWRCFPPIHKRHHNNKVPILFFAFIFCEICCGCEKDRCSTVATAFPDILSRRYFHSAARACGLYTLLKNEYSTLAVQMHGRNHVRNRNRTRGKPINGIQRNQVGAA